jgi:hypothetical protein
MKVLVHTLLGVGAGEDVPRSRFTVEFRPRLRAWEFFRDLFALPVDQRGHPRIGNLARLLRAYPDEFLYLPVIPVSVQRALAVPLSKFGSVSR